MNELNRRLREWPHLDAVLNCATGHGLRPWQLIYIYY